MLCRDAVLEFDERSEILMNWGDVIFAHELAKVSFKLQTATTSQNPAGSFVGSSLLLFSTT